MKQPQPTLHLNGAAYYVSNESLIGGSDLFNRASILQWIYWADSSLWFSLNVKSKSPKFDIRTDPFNNLYINLEYLNNILDDRTFLVQDRISLADVAVFTCLLPLLKLDVKLKATEHIFVNVYRWFYTLFDHQYVKNVVFHMC